MDIESQQPIPKCLKWTPIASLAISITSFMFSVIVLYPWHLELSREFGTLENSCRN